MSLSPSPFRTTTLAQLLAAHADQLEELVLDCELNQALIDILLCSGWLSTSSSSAHHIHLCLQGAALCEPTLLSALFLSAAEVPNLAASITPCVAQTSGEDWVTPNEFVWVIRDFPAISFEQKSNNDFWEWGYR